MLIKLACWGCLISLHLAHSCLNPSYLHLSKCLLKVIIVSTFIVSFGSSFQIRTILNGKSCRDLSYNFPLSLKLSPLVLESSTPRGKDWVFTLFINLMNPQNPTLQAEYVSVCYSKHLPPFKSRSICILLTWPHSCCRRAIVRVSHSSIGRGSSWHERILSRSYRQKDTLQRRGNQLALKVKTIMAAVLTLPSWTEIVKMYY